MYDYGECEICNTPLQERKIKQSFWIKDRLVVIENIPAGVCPRCGEKIVNAAVGERLAAFLQDGKRIDKAPAMAVPLIRYQVATVAA